jgi:hypothetical protein
MMPFSLYLATVPTFQQTLGAMLGLLDKTQDFCIAHDRPISELLQSRLAHDMLPFTFQIRSTVTHSVGALEATGMGVFKPDRSPPPEGIDDLRRLVSEALATLASTSAHDIDNLVGRDMRFEMGETVMPFAAENFLMSFSLPNFFFHAATAYDILRFNGLPIGKRDYLGRPRTKT